jgi:myo-inositol-1-phosphate synthase
VLVCYLPVGSEEAAKFYAQCAIDAGVAFVNALPVFIAGDPEWAKKFDRRRRADRRRRHQEPGRRHHHPPRAGQAVRGPRRHLDRTYQLNVGGNMDFMNMLERERLESKKISKTQSVTSTSTTTSGARNVHIGPSRLRRVARRPQVGVRPPRGPQLRRRPAEPRVQARGLGLPELGRRHHRRAARAKIAKDRGIGGPILSASSYFMKSPPVQYSPPPSPSCCFRTRSSGRSRACCSTGGAAGRCSCAPTCSRRS